MSRPVTPKIGTPPPLSFFTKHLKANRLRKMEDCNQQEINNLKIQAKITPYRNKGLTKSTPSSIPGCERKSSSFEPSRSRSIGQRPVTAVQAIALEPGVSQRRESNLPLCGTETRTVTPRTFASLPRRDNECVRPSDIRCPGQETIQ
jgi:hypothetical protein